MGVRSNNMGSKCFVRICTFKPLTLFKLSLSLGADVSADNSPKMMFVAVLQCC